MYLVATVDYSFFVPHAKTVLETQTRKIAISFFKIDEEAVQNEYYFTLTIENYKPELLIYG